MLLVGEPISHEETILAYPSKSSDYIYPHGLTPPLRWVRKRRFRKRISNRVWFLSFLLRLQVDSLQVHLFILSVLYSDINDLDHRTSRIKTKRTTKSRLRSPDLNLRNPPPQRPPRNPIQLPCPKRLRIPPSPRLRRRIRPIQRIRGRRIRQRRRLCGRTRANGAGSRYACSDACAGGGE